MPLETEKFRYELCMWFLDQVRVHLPRKCRPLAQKVYAIEADMRNAWETPPDAR